jgi:hypothetical protein
LFDEEWIAEFEDTSWLRDIGNAVQGAPFDFFGSLFLDVAMGALLFGVLWFLVERWVQDTKAAIARRELWDDEQKRGELERTTLLHRYLVTASAFVGLCLTLGLFSLRYRVPVLQTLARTVQTWLLDSGLSRIIAIAIVGAVVYSLLRVVRKTARALTPVSGQRFERQVARAATIRNVIESTARLVLITFFVLFVLAQVGVTSRRFWPGSAFWVWRSRSARSRWLKTLSPVFYSGRRPVRCRRRGDDYGAFRGRSKA